MCNCTSEVCIFDAPRNDGGLARFIGDFPGLQRLGRLS